MLRSGPRDIHGFRLGRRRRTGNATPFVSLTTHPSRPRAASSAWLTRRYVDLEAHQQIHPDRGLTVQDVNEIQVHERANVRSGSLETEHDGVGERAARRVDLQTRVPYAAVQEDETVANGRE